LKHSLAAEVVREFAVALRYPPANHRQVLPQRRVFEELLDHVIARGGRLGEQQHAGSKSIDAVNHQRALPAPLHVLVEDGEGGRRFRILDGHGGQSGGLVDGHECLVLVEYGDLAGKAGVALCGHT
jgi:hypothetical protein